MKSKFKVLLMLGTHAATCDRVSIFILSTTKVGTSQPHLVVCTIPCNLYVYSLFYPVPGYE